jgi:2-C-methyl-D-erythritol 4-phosphate cytidylyltransferase
MSTAVHALVPAAGIGERFGGRVPKQFVEVAGRPVLAWTLDRLLSAGLASVTVGLPLGRLASASRAIHGDGRIGWVAGGATRQETVELCLMRCAAGPDDLVLVHDGARPALARWDLEATLEAARGSGGAVLGRPVADTLKRVEGGEIVATVDRRGLFRAETPQVFRRTVLQLALETSRADGFEATDEAALVARLSGASVVLVEARFPNPKLTDPADLALIAALVDP